MSRRSRARWFHVAGPLIVLAGLAALAVWLGPGFRPRPDPPDRDGLALVLLENVTGPDGRAESQRVLRVAVRSGEVTPAETVWEGDVSFFAHHDRHHLLDGRYVVAATGGVIDTWAGEVIHKPPRFGEVLDAAGGKVVYRTVDDGAVFTFDVRTREDVRMADAARKYALPGVRSPDGAKSVERRGGELLLHRVGQEPVALGSDFHVGQAPESSNAGHPPVLWLDSERFLTQVRNGVLVVVAADGTRSPAVTVPARHDVIGAPRLSRDPGGRVVYECGGEEFLIDADGRTWERSEWVGLGHGFDASREARAGGVTVRYRGREIGRCVVSPRARGYFATTDGHMAMMGVQDSRPAVRPGAYQVGVWSATTGEWVTLEPPWPAYLIGWTK
jgi:hypothetical protein